MSDDDILATVFQRLLQDGNVWWFLDEENGRLSIDGYDGAWASVALEPREIECLRRVLEVTDA